jgi:phosphate starvation-inducible PhoH-like protein
VGGLRPAAGRWRASTLGARRAATTLRSLQQVLSVSNEVAAELATVDDGILGALRDRMGCAIRLRGNQLTLEGDDGKVGEARLVIDELVDLVEGGHAIGPNTVDAVLAALDAAKDPREIFEDVVWRHRGKKITPKTVNQKRYVDAIRSGTITFGIGPAGTGKTYLAMALAVAALADRDVNRLILTRPAVEAGERLGFLPGDMLAKVDPYLRPLFDALYDMLDADRLNAYMERGTIEVAPLAFMRGRTLNDSFIILDEAQNTSPEQMQMFLTRLGFGSKVVVTGDVTQVDLPPDQASGLIHVRQILGDIDGIEFVEFGHQDVVRHVLVQRIVEAYKRHAEETGTQRRR